MNRSLLRTTAERVRTLKAMAQRNARLLSLSKLAAGLAHELNNPAAALSRSGHHLEMATEELAKSIPMLCSAGLSMEASHHVAELLAALTVVDPCADTGLMDEREDRWGHLPGSISYLPPPAAHCCDTSTPSWACEDKASMCAIARDEFCRLWQPSSLTRSLIRSRSR